MYFPEVNRDRELVGFSYGDLRSVFPATAAGRWYRRDLATRPFRDSPRRSARRFTQKNMMNPVVSPDANNVVGVLTAKRDRRLPPPDDGPPPRPESLIAAPARRG